MSSRIAIFSHSHPVYSRGGSENVAYDSFCEFQSSGHDAHIFCAINPHIRHEANIFYENEYLVDYTRTEHLFPATGFDNFIHTHRNGRILKAVLTAFEKAPPDIFHFHHFWNVGTDLIESLMRRFPKAKFGLTLHEFLAICHRDGQMLKRPSNTLCEEANDVACHLCFPEIDRMLFDMRRRHLQTVLEGFDMLVAPSRFLADRFRHWGLKKDVYVLENGLRLPAAVRAEPDSFELTRRFAFFGQPTPFKGLDIFVSAADLSLKSGQVNAAFRIYGCDEAAFLAQYGERWAATLARLGTSLQFMGRYEHKRVFDLMTENGWIVVPSIWWENSPLVIQEAFAARRPPIVADIGGMREKVEDGVDGLHFAARDMAGLAQTMGRAAGNEALWHDLRSRITPPPTIGEMNEALLAMYHHTPARSHR